MSKPPTSGRPAMVMRWDVEDFLTPAADWALDAILRTLTDYEIRANFAVVGLKARELIGSGRGSWIGRMAEQGSVGSHSWSHSIHPTLAELLDPLTTPAAAAAAFHARERRTVELLSAKGHPPQFFTQPGANWVPEVLTTGRDLGFRVFLTEAWNSYLKPDPRPVWVGRVLHWAFPVDVPKGFLMQLPGGVDEAVAMVVDAWASGRAAGFVSHPTELVTRRFWDVANFGGGQNRGPWIPAPTRPAAEWRQALDGLRRFLEQVAAHRPRWITVDQLPTEPPAPHEASWAAVETVLKTTGFGPAGTWTTAELLWCLVHWQAAGDRQSLTVPVLDAPDGAVNGADPLEAVLAFADRARRLPTEVNGKPLAAFAREVLKGSGFGEPVWPLLQWVRPASDLHWHWPIFRPGFTAPRLLAEAQRLAWIIRPAGPGPWDVA